MAARASEEADTYALTNRPALDTSAQSIDPTDHFMSRYTRPANREKAFHRARVRVAHPASRDANAYLMGTGITKRLLYL
jgi:hypothetical protein